MLLPFLLPMLVLVPVIVPGNRKLLVIVLNVLSISYTFIQES